MPIVCFYNTCPFLHRICTIHAHFLIEFAQYMPISPSNLYNTCPFFYWCCTLHTHFSIHFVDYTPIFPLNVWSTCHFPHGIRTLKDYFLLNLYNILLFSHWIWHIPLPFSHWIVYITWPFPIERVRVAVPHEGKQWASGEERQRKQAWGWRTAHP